MFAVKVLLLHGEYCPLDKVLRAAQGEGTIGVICRDGKRFLLVGQERGGLACQSGLIQAGCFSLSAQT